ncbi:MAG: hypothetical protein IJD45_04455 [Clostridia bacterium]|nr:hypothetical protein [Clostridia bacterium]
MKKIIAVLFAVVLMLVPFAVTAGAAGALSADEQRIVDFLSDEYKIGKTDYKLPDEYINQAKNYFLTIDVNKTQADTIIAELQKAVDELKATVLPTDDFNIKVLPQAVKEDILKAGKDACAVVGLDLSYNSATSKVEITKAAATPGAAPTVVFNDEPVIKTTGASVNVSAIILTVSALIALVAVSVVVSKKIKLF